MPNGRPVTVVIDPTRTWVAPFPSRLDIIPIQTGDSSQEATTAPLLLLFPSFAPGAVLGFEGEQPLNTGRGCNPFVAVQLHLGTVQPRTDHGLCSVLPTTSSVAP